MKLRLSVFLLMLVVLVYAAQWYSERQGFTPWMSMKQLDTYLKPLEEKDADGKNYWDRRWVTDIQSRWHEGMAEYRIRVGDSPKDGPRWWYWYLNQDAATFNSRLADLGNQNFTLVSSTSLEWPDGTKRYCGVWHRVGPQ